MKVTKSHLLCLMFLWPVVGSSQVSSCKMFFTKFNSPQAIRPPEGYSLRWGEVLVDGLTVFGPRDWGISIFNAMGVRPKYVYRGLGSVFVLQPNELPLNAQQLKNRALRLRKMIHSASGNSNSSDEKALAYFFINQIQYLNHHHNFNIYGRIALSWAETTPSAYAEVGDGKQARADSALRGLQSLKFILRIPLPPKKQYYPDDDGPQSIGSSNDGLMTVFESHELKPDQIEKLVYRVKYQGKWFWPNGLIKEYWRRLLFLNQRSVEFLVSSDERLTGEELLLELRNIYSAAVAIKMP